jgi:hypothetical protein
MGMGKERFGQVLQMLPEGWEAKAKELGALRRAREIKTPEELLRLILLYMTEGKSFAGTSALLQLTDENKMSKVAVFKMELFTLAARELLVTDRKTGEKLSNFTELGKRDIVRGDRAYGSIPGIEYLRGRKAGYVLRIHSRTFPVCNGKGRAINLLQLKRGETADIPAYYVANGGYHAVRICALRKDRENERAGIKRLTHDSQRKRGGRAVSEAQRENNKYIIVATSLEGEVSASEVLELYRARWQIELAFKRLKSLFQYSDLPAKRDESVRAWFYGKLLLAALCETLVNTGRFSPRGAALPQNMFG